jgi:hypothetical protein
MGAFFLRMFVANSSSRFEVSFSSPNSGLKARPGGVLRTFSQTVAPMVGIVVTGTELAIL